MDVRILAVVYEYSYSRRGLVHSYRVQPRPRDPDGVETRSASLIAGVGGERGGGSQSLAVGVSAIVICGLRWRPGSRAGSVCLCACGGAVRARIMPLRSRLGRSHTHTRASVCPHE